MEAQQTMNNMVAICRQRHEELLRDSQWKEVLYNRVDVTHDVLCVLYNPIGAEGEKDLHDVLAYINKNFGSRIYFYINKDVEGLKNVFSITDSIGAPETIEG